MLWYDVALNSIMRNGDVRYDQSAQALLVSVLLHVSANLLHHHLPLRLHTIYRCLCLRILESAQSSIYSPSVESAAQSTSIQAKELGHRVATGVKRRRGAGRLTWGVHCRAKVGLARAVACQDGLWVGNLNSRADCL